MPSLTKDLPSLPVNEYRSHVGGILSTLQSDAALSEKMAGRGWTPEKTDALVGQYDRFVETVQAHDALDARQREAADAFDTAESTFRRGAFRDHVDLADGAFHDNVEARAALKLDDSINNLSITFNQWAPDAEDFYSILDARDDLRAELRDYVSEAELRDGAEELARIQALKQTRDTLDADRQQARHDRDTARAALTAKMRRMQKIGLVALRGDEAITKIGYTLSTEELEALSAEPSTG